MLQRHVDTADSAILITLPAAKKCALPEWTKVTKELAMMGESFPTPLKHMVLDKWIGIYSEAKDWAKFMSALLPWHFGEQENDADFVPSQPMLNAMEGSASDKGSVFGRHVLSKMTAFIRKGQAAHADLMTYLEFVSQFLVDHELQVGSDGEGDQNIDPYDVAADMLTTVCTSIKLLKGAGTSSVDKKLVASASRLDEILCANELVGRSASDSPFVLLSSALHACQEVWAEKIVCWRKHKVAMIKHIPAAIDCVADLGTAKVVGESSCILPMWSAALKEVILPAFTELPLIMYQQYEEQLSEVLSKSICAALKLCKGEALEAADLKLCGGDIAKIDKLELTKSLKSFLDDIKKYAPSIGQTLVAETEQSLETIVSNTMQIQTASTLKDALDEFMKSGKETNKDHWMTLSSKLKEGKANMTDVDTALQPFEDKVYEISVDCMMRWGSCVAADRGILLSLLEELQSCMTVDFAKENFDADIGLCTMLVKAHDAGEDWTKLGIADEERLTADPMQLKLLSWKTSIEQLKGKKMTAKNLDPEVVNACIAEHEASLSSISAMVLKASSSLADASLLTVTTHLANVPWPCAEASGGEKGWEAFVENAQMTWLSYAGGDTLLTDAAHMKKHADAWKACAEIWGEELGDKVGTAALVANKVDALVFSVKAMKAIEKLEKEGSDLKLRRYAKARKHALTQEQHSMMKQFVPDDLQSKFTALAS